MLGIQLAWAGPTQPIMLRGDAVAAGCRLCKARLDAKNFEIYLRAGCAHKT